MDEYRPGWELSHVSHVTVYIGHCPHCPGPFPYETTPHVFDSRTDHYQHDWEQKRAAAGELRAHLLTHFPDGLPESRCGCGFTGTHDEVEAHLYSGHPAGGSV